MSWSMMIGSANSRRMYGFERESLTAQSYAQFRMTGPSAGSEPHACAQMPKRCSERSGTMMASLHVSQALERAAVSSRTSPTPRMLNANAVSRSMIEEAPAVNFAAGDRHNEGKEKETKGPGGQA